MARRRKPKTILGMIISMLFAPIGLLFWIAGRYRPYNSKGAKISRSKKKRWF